MCSEELAVLLVWHVTLLSDFVSFLKISERKKTDLIEKQKSCYINLIKFVPAHQKVVFLSLKFHG